MSVATMTSKGQVTIPVDVRKALNAEAGSKLEFIADGEGAFRIVPKKHSVMGLLGSLKGCSAASAAVSLEDMDEAIAAQAVERYLRVTGITDGGDK